MIDTILKRRRFFAIVLTLTTLALLFLGSRITIPPLGRFRAVGIGSEGDAYYEFADGKLRFIILDSENKNKLTERIIGDYRKVNGQWMIIMPDGKMAPFRVTLLYLKYIGTNGKTSAEFPRMLGFP